MNKSEGLISPELEAARDEVALMMERARVAQAKIAESIGKSQNALIVPNETAGLFGAMASLAKGYETIKRTSPTVSDVSTYGSK